MSTRSSAIDLYASDNKADNSLKYRMAVDAADVIQSGVQDMKFDMKSFQFKQDGEGSYWNLGSRFASLESDVSANQAAHNGDISNLSTQLAAEIVDRTSGDTTLQNGLTAETNARTTQCNAIAADLQTQIAAQVADRDASNAAIAQEVTDRNSAVQAEAAARTAAIATVNASINSILSNTDPAAIDSLTEVVNAYTSGDTTLANQAAGMLTRIAALEDVVNDLLAEHNL